MDEKVEYYVNYIYDALNYWTNIFWGTDINDQGFEIKEYLTRRIKAILRNGREHLLTNDHLAYLALVAYRQYGDVNGINNLLLYLEDSDDFIIEDMYYGYYRELIYSDFHDYFIDVNYFRSKMTPEDLRMFDRLSQLYNDINEMNFRPRDRMFLMHILMKIILYCKKNNKYDMFDILVNKYLIDPKKTLERFYMNGVMDVYAQDNAKAHIYMISDFENNIGGHIL